MEFFEEAGVPLKVERGNRVAFHSPPFLRHHPRSERELKKAGADSSSYFAVQEIVKKPVTDSVNTLESEAALTESGSDAGKSRKKIGPTQQEEKSVPYRRTHGKERSSRGNRRIIRKVGSTGETDTAAQIPVTEVLLPLVPQKTKEDISLKVLFSSRIQTYHKRMEKKNLARFSSSAHSLVIVHDIGKNWQHKDRLHDSVDHCRTTDARTA